MRFPEYMCSPDTPIHIKEFIIVIICIRLWGKNWTGQRILIYCDNTSVCDTCSYQKPSDPSMQKLLREFLYWVCKFNFHPIIEKISTKDNHIADFISRNHNEDDISSYLSKRVSWIKQLFSGAETTMGHYFVKRSQQNVLSHLRQLSLFCVTFHVPFLPVSRDTTLGFIELMSCTFGFNQV